jgi:hypothetical protein
LGWVIFTLLSLEIISKLAQDSIFNIGMQLFFVLKPVVEITIKISLRLSFEKEISMAKLITLIGNVALMG